MRQEHGITENMGSLKRVLAAVIRNTLAAFMVIHPASFSVAESSSDDKADTVATVGVLDITMEERGGSQDDWALGLADLLDLELQKRGLNTYERRDVRLVLGERNLQLSGQAGNDEVLRNFLPWVRYLVKGSVRRANGGFVLSIGVVDVRDGLSVMTLDEKGDNPNRLAKALERMADRISASLAAKTTGVEHRLPMPGFTDTPEVALLYYRGVEYLVAGRPGYAIDCFSQAAKADPSFMLARWWKMKAYQQAGFPRLAQMALEEITLSGLGAGFLAYQQSGGHTGRQQRVVAVIAGQADSDEGRVIATALGGQLRRDVRVLVFDPTWLPNLGAEADLDLSGMYQREPGLRSTIWAMTDSMAFVLPSGSHGWKLAVRDSLSGEERMAMPIANNTASIRAAAEALATTGVTGTPRAAVRSPPSKKRDFPEMLNRYTDKTVAFDDLLNGAEQDESELKGIMRLAEWFASVPDAKYERAAWETLMDRIDPDAGDAAMWYSTALWHLHDLVWKPRMDITDFFRVLYEQYPDSVPAMFCRYSRACYYLERVAPGPDPVQARDILVPLADRMVAGLPSEFRSPQFIGSIYYRTAQAYEGCGQTNEAMAWLEKARRAMAGADEDLRIWYRIGIGYDRNVNPALIEDIVAVADAKHGNRLNRNIRAMAERLAGRSDEPDLVADQDLPWNEFVEKVERSRGEDAYRLRRLYLERVSRDKLSGGPSAECQRTLLYINWLYTRTWTAQQRDELKLLADGAAQRVGVLDTADFALAMGDYSEAVRRSGGPTSETICLTDGYPAHIRHLLDQTREKIDRIPAYQIWNTAKECMYIGLFEEAVDLYREAHSKSANNPRRQTEIALDWARCEMLRGDDYKASELLRQIAQPAEGFDPSLTADLRTRALSELRILRLDGHIPSRNVDWMWHNQSSCRFAGCSSFEWVPPLKSDPLTEMEDDLYRILSKLWCYPPQWGAPQSITPTQDIDRYVKKYGREAVPLLIKAYERTGYGIQDSHVVDLLLQRVAGPDDKALILESFCHEPQLAPVAFKLDPEAAKRITLERMPALRGVLFNYRLQDALIANRVEDAFPVLFRNLANEAIPPHTIAARLSQALEGCNTNLVEGFRLALSVYLGDALRRDENWTAPGGGIVGVFEIAMQYGVVEGVHALVDYHYAIMTDAQKYEILSRYVELPPDPSKALADLRACGDCLQWDPQARKFRMKNGVGATKNPVAHEVAP